MFVGGGAGFMPAGFARHNSFRGGAGSPSRTFS
jgi:hypothetical protein